MKANYSFSRIQIASPWFLIFCALIFSSCQSGKDTPVESVTPERKPASYEAVTAWQNQKYSMFIHFGLFSEAAGVWKNKPVTKGYSEQIRAHGKITKEEFHALAKTFNPLKWNPDSIATLARRAGMKSIVITSKHHDGFAMYDTKYSEFNIVDATPYKQDVIKGLADACGKQGLRFGVYFSLIDWDFPGALPISDHNSDSIPPEHHQLNMHQVEELMTNYGAISEIWFDMGKPTLQQSAELANLVKRLQPDCLVSGRLWNDQGDFAVMGDNASPDFRMGTLWQTPASIFHETWGYRSWQKRGDVQPKALEKLSEMIKVVSNGGNYLLNIGPMGDGRVVPFERDVLLTIGKWLEKNGQSIYASNATSLPEQSWGVITEKPGRLFLLVLRTPGDGHLVLKGLKSNVKKAFLLSDTTRALSIKEIPGESAIYICKATPQEMIKVVVVEYEGDLDYTPSKTIALSSDGTYSLTEKNAIKYHSYSGRDYYSTKPTVIKMEWLITNAVEGPYTMKMSFPANYKGKKFAVTINDDERGIILDQKGDINEMVLDGFKLIPGKINRVSVGLAGESNPHKDMDANELVMTLKK